MWNYIWIHSTKDKIVSKISATILNLNNVGSFKNVQTVEMTKPGICKLNTFF